MSASPSLRSLLVEHWVGAADVEVETLDIGLVDASLLHRDAPAERSRLVTRGFRRGAVRSWWTVDEPARFLARVTLFRLADPSSAALACADSWSDLHAADVGVHHRGAHSIAVASERHDDDELLWSALWFGAFADLVIGVVAGSVDSETAIAECNSLVTMQVDRLSVR